MAVSPVSHRLQGTQDENDDGDDAIVVCVLLTQFAKKEKKKKFRQKPVKKTKAYPAKCKLTSGESRTPMRSIPARVVRPFTFWVCESEPGADVMDLHINKVAQVQSLELHVVISSMSFVRPRTVWPSRIPPPRNFLFLFFRKEREMRPPPLPSKTCRILKGLIEHWFWYCQNKTGFFLSCYIYIFHLFSLNVSPRQRVLRF